MSKNNCPFILLCRITVSHYIISDTGFRLKLSNKLNSSVTKYRHLEHSKYLKFRSIPLENYSSLIKHKISTTAINLKWKQYGKKKKKKRIINNYPVVIHFYVKWSAPSFGSTGFFSKMTIQHHICTLDLGIKFNVTNRKLAVMAHFSKIQKSLTLDCHQRTSNFHCTVNHRFQHKLTHQTCQ